MNMYIYIYIMGIYCGKTESKEEHKMSECVNVYEKNLYSR